MQYCSITCSPLPPCGNNHLWIGWEFSFGVRPSGRQPLGVGSPSLINRREKSKDRTMRVPILCACSMRISKTVNMELPVMRSILDPTNQGVIPRMALGCMKGYEQRAIPTPGREIWFCVKERGSISP